MCKGSQRIRGYRDRLRGTAIFEEIAKNMDTCAVYRAIHLELVASLSTDDFLQALRRFIARRGRPTIIYTDKGKNFIGARNLLQKIEWDKIKLFSTIQ